MAASTRRRAARALYPSSQPTPSEETAPPKIFDVRTPDIED
ncbi:MAG TPA: hypothetical protein VM911_07965 [Pyrinomonadaceae bacterium]|nr:hypothetical protein [Pyrinomonadaceae bacterium]